MENWLTTSRLYSQATFLTTKPFSTRSPPLQVDTNHSPTQLNIEKTIQCNLFIALPPFSERGISSQLRKIWTSESAASLPWLSWWSTNRISLSLTKGAKKMAKTIATIPTEFNSTQTEEELRPLILKAKPSNHPRRVARVERRSFWKRELCPCTIKMQSCKARLKFPIF